MKAKSLISEDEFSQYSNDLMEKERVLLSQSNQSESWVARAKQIASLSETICFILENGTPIQKREALSQFCSNLILNEKKLYPTIISEVKVFIDGLNRTKADNPLFEPRNIVDTSSRNLVFTQAIPSLLPG
jgi:hypothetical protein